MLQNAKKKLIFGFFRVQYGDPLKACFKAVAPLKRQFIDDLDHYLQVMGKYEDNIYQLSRKNGLGAKSISRLPNEPRNGSKHGSTKRFVRILG